MITEAGFESRHNADRDELRRFHESVADEDDRYSQANPGYRLAPEYFQFYLEHRPAERAVQALGFAFDLWGRLKGVTDDVREALEHTLAEEEAAPELRQLWSEAWDSVAWGVRDAFLIAGELKAGLALLEDSAKGAASSTGPATLLRVAARDRAHFGDTEIGRRDCQRILELDTGNCAWSVEHDARGLLHEFDNLNIGQPSPHFALPDIDGNQVDLKDHLGKVVLLTFWSTTCPFCADEFSHLKESRRRYPKHSFSLIGVSLDEEMEELRKCVVRDGLDWPQICEGNCWRDTLATLYNITSVPSSYILDQSGTIAAKRKRGDDLLAALESLLS